MLSRNIFKSRSMINVCTFFGFVGLLLTCFVHPASTDESQENRAKTKTIEIPFKSHDGYEMFGKLTLPDSDGRHAVVIYVQTAEGMTVDMKRPLRNTTFNYFDLYREKLPEMNVGFFGYEGRGIRMGDAPPRYEKIDWEIYNTSTLENKVRDIMSAVRVVAKQAGVDASRIFLMGASEGTLLAAEAASRMPKEIAGLVLYGVISSNMRETYKYIMTGGNFIAVRRYFDTDKDGRISKAEFEADLAHHALAKVAQLPIAPRGHGARQVVAHRSDRRGDRHIIVVENDDQPGVHAPDIVQRLVDHAGAHGAVADHRDDPVAVALEVARHSEASGGRHRRARVRGAARVVVAFLALGET